jgi:hypothetical protein
MAVRASGFRISPELGPPDLAAMRLLQELGEIAATDGGIRERLFSQPAVSVPVSVHQPAPDRTQAAWLDLAPDLSRTDSTQACCVDVEHQPTDRVLRISPILNGS